MNMYKFLVIFCVIFVVVDGLTTFGTSRWRCARHKLNNGRVRWQGRGKYARYQCSTGYSLAGVKINTCLTYRQGHVWESPIPNCVRPTCRKPKLPDHGFYFAEFRGAVLQYFCLPGFDLRGRNQTFCDGLDWSEPHIPSCIETGQEPKMSCDFETDDLCGWSNDLNHNFDWTRHNLKTPSGHIETGPSFDHTKGPEEDGYYVYIESSSRSINDTARLISPVFNKMEQGFCFKFFYHMYGTGIGRLRVYVKKESDPSSTDLLKPLFARSGNHGDHWLEGSVSLPSVDEYFQIIIEGVRGQDYKSDIAIDDVSIFNESCPVDTDSSTMTDVTEMFDSTNTPPEYMIDSCFNRCDVEINPIISPHSCDCVDTCQENNTCCPDYIAICILGPTEDDFTSESTIQTTEEIPKLTYNIISKMPSETTQPPKRTQPFKIPTEIPKTTQPAKITTKILPKTETPMVPKKPTQKIILPTKKITQPPKIMTESLEIITQPPKTTQTPKKIPTKTTPKTTSKTTPKTTPKTTSPTLKTTLKTTPKTMTQKTIPPKKTLPPKIIQTTKITKLVPIIPPKRTFAPPIVTEESKIIPTEYTRNPNAKDVITESYIDYTQKYPEIETDFEVPQEIEAQKTPKFNTPLIGGIVGVVILMIFVVLVVIVVVKRKNIRLFRNFRYKSSHSESMSDVRFLTSDEVLDFSLRSTD